MTRASNKWINSIVFLTFLLSGTRAFAASDRRNSFNFGTSARLISDSNQSDSQGSSSTSNSGQSFAPYIGYGFGVLNLGLVGLIQTENTSVDEKKKDATQEIKRESKISTKAVSIFARLLFGKYMFLEGGGGYYTRTIATTSFASTSVASNKAEVTNDAVAYDLAGLGIHYGGGIELPVVNGFYVTGSYIARTVQFRDVNSGSEIGSKFSTYQEQELMFGLAYYY